MNQQLSMRKKDYSRLIALVFLTIGATFCSSCENGHSNTFRDKIEITFENYNGDFLCRDYIDYNTNAVYYGPTPTKPDCDGQSYRFSGWDKPLTNIVVDTLFVAQFQSCDAMVIATWINHDGTYLGDSLVAYGEIPRFDGEVPIKKSDEMNDYVFDGWSPRPKPIFQDTIYVAQFTESPKTPHTYDGEKIDLGNCFWVDPTDSFGGGQAGCKYGNYFFRFESDNSFKAYKISNKSFLGSFVLNSSLSDDTLAPHCNTACFGLEFYNEDDEFPLVYVNSYTNSNLPYAELYAFRLTRYGDVFESKIVQTITIGFTDTDFWATKKEGRPQGNFVIDTQNSILYSYVSRTDLYSTRFFKFNLPSINEGSNVVLEIEDVLEYFDAARIYTPQDNCYYNNKLYISYGGDNDGHIVVLDLESKSFVTKIDFYQNNIFWEPECIEIVDNRIYCGYFRLFIFTF